MPRTLSTDSRALSFLANLYMFDPIRGVMGP